MATRKRKVSRAMSFQDFVRNHPSTISDDELAKINRVTTNHRFEAGDLVKTVAGGDLP